MHTRVYNPANIFLHYHMMEPGLSFDRFDQLPMADCHLHLDGAIPPDVLYEVAQKHQIIIPELRDQSLAALSEVYPNPGPFSGKNAQDFSLFLKQFERSLSVMQTPQSIYDTTLGVIHDLKKQNIIYAELRFAPSYHLQNGHSMKEMTEAVLRAMKQGEQETGVMTRLLVIIPREIAYLANEQYHGPNADQIVSVALEFQNEGVAGIDLACNEVLYGPEAYERQFQKTFGTRLKRTVHAGESGDNRQRNIEFALKNLQADGLGHALDLTSMPVEWKNYVLAKKIRVERSPVSNQILGVGDARLDDFSSLYHASTLVTINSDDPGVFGETCRLAANYKKVFDSYNWGIEHFLRLTRNAIDSAFVDKYGREDLLNRFCEALKPHELKLPDPLLQ